MNCWEFKKCGREEGGVNVEEFGICPVFSFTKTNGINSGTNGGRCCWAITGTFCGGEVQGTFADKVVNCMNCDFYKLVWKEEQKNNYKTPVEIIRILKENSENKNNE